MGSTPPERQAARVPEGASGLRRHHRSQRSAGSVRASTTPWARSGALDPAHPRTLAPGRGNGAAGEGARAGRNRGSTAATCTPAGTSRSSPPTISRHGWAGCRHRGTSWHRVTTSVGDCLRPSPLCGDGGLRAIGGAPGCLLTLQQGHSRADDRWVLTTRSCPTAKPRLNALRGREAAFRGLQDPANRGTSRPSGSGASICNSQLLRGNQQRLGTPTRALGNRYPQGR